MPKFAYIRPGSIEETILLLGMPEFENKILAGGTDLLLDLRNHTSSETSLRLIDISRIPELHYIQLQEDQVSIGATATFTEIIQSPILQETFPILIQACKKIGGPQIRNMATVGGNIANAAACADSLPVLACLHARLHLQSSQGNRNMPIEQFILGKNKTICQKNEILTSISLPLLPQGAKGVFIKLGRRNAQTTSRLTVAVVGRLSNNGRVDTVRIVPGSVTDKILFYPEAEALLLNHPPTPERLRQCSLKVIESMIHNNSKRWSTDYKAPVLAKLTERALSQVFLSNIS
ncbi:MAG: hypothetical protein HPY59_04245 [Anaerolineae bacterium]|nr:hypothetical protein [Anaerolineae bacterium]